MKVSCTSIVAASRFRASKSAGSQRLSLADADVLQGIAGRSPFGASAILRQDPVNHATGDVGQPEVSTLIAVGKPLMVDPQ